MLNGKRRYVKIFSLLIICACISDGLKWVAVQANSGELLEVEQITERNVSSNKEQPLQKNVFEESAADDYETSEWDEENVNIISVNEDNCESEGVVDDVISSNSILSNNNELPLDISPGKPLEVSGNHSIDIEARENVFDVVLPTEVPFDIILWEGEELKGAVFSKKFYIENKGDEDICIAIQGICQGENQEDYVFSNRSVEDELIYGKKNVWIYLRWEDKDGKGLELPEIAMGDSVNPGKGEIILKAPEKDSEGQSLGDNFASRVFFSIRGELNSDKGEWKNDELKVKLDFSMKTINSGNSIDSLESMDLKEELGITKEDAGSVSNNIGDINELQEIISNNANDNYLGEDDGLVSANSSENN